MGPAIATALIGLTVNDSGVAVPAVAFTVLVPVAAAASLRAVADA